MGAESVLSDRKASRIFFELLKGRARAAGLTSRCGLERADVDRALARMERAGLVEKMSGAIFAIDWVRFVPLFLSQAMNIYSMAMRWKFVPYYMDTDPVNVIEAACARAERELAMVKVKLSDNDGFFQIVQSFFLCLAADVDAPEDFLADMRIHDAIDEFEYALLKLMPTVRAPKNAPAPVRELIRMLKNWYRAIQGFDNTPTDAALRMSLTHYGLIIS